jgi:hypothetical protein
LTGGGAAGEPTGFGAGLSRGAGFGHACLGGRAGFPSADFGRVCFGAAADTAGDHAGGGEVLGEGAGGVAVVVGLDVGQRVGSSGGHPGSTTQRRVSV